MPEVSVTQAEAETQEACEQSEYYDCTFYRSGEEFRRTGNGGNHSDRVDRIQRIRSHPLVGISRCGKRIFFWSILKSETIAVYKIVPPFTRYFKIDSEF